MARKEKPKLTDYITGIIDDIENNEDTAMPVFEKVDYKRGIAYPTQLYWRLWKSHYKQDLIDAHLTPTPHGHDLGLSIKWIVRLPAHIYPRTYHPTRTMSEVLSEMGLNV